MWNAQPPKPPTKFCKYRRELLTHVEAAAKESMRRAAEEAVQLNEGSRDIPAAFDGSWQKRGHTSNNGIVSATSVETGKVLDVEVITKFCRLCTSRNACRDQEHDQKQCQ